MIVLTVGHRSASLIEEETESGSEDSSTAMLKPVWGKLIFRRSGRHVNMTARHYTVGPDSMVNLMCKPENSFSISHDEEANVTTLTSETGGGVRVEGHLAEDGAVLEGVTHIGEGLSPLIYQRQYAKPWGCATMKTGVEIGKVRHFVTQCVNRSER